MPAPTVSLTTDKPTYAPGALITATVVYAAPAGSSWTITGTATDAQGNQATAIVQISDPVTVKVTDSSNRVYTKISDNGSTAVFTATA